MHNKGTATACGYTNDGYACAAVGWLERYSGPTRTMTSPPRPCRSASLPSIHVSPCVFMSIIWPSPIPLTPLTLRPFSNLSSSSCVTCIGFPGLLTRSSVPITDLSPLYFRSATSIRALTGALANAFGCGACEEPKVTEEMKPCAASRERMERF